MTPKQREFLNEIYRDHNVEYPEDQDLVTLGFLEGWYAGLRNMCKMGRLPPEMLNKVMAEEEDEK
jgi:hypothetical protein